MAHVVELLPGERIQNIVSRIDAIGHRTDSDSQPGKSPATQRPDYRLEPFMASIASLATDTYPSHRQVDIVADNEHTVERHILAVLHIAHGPAAQIHESDGFQKAETRHLQGSPADQPESAIGFENKIEIPGKVVENHKTNIVTGKPVFSAWVTEPDHQAAISCRIFDSIGHLYHPLLSLSKENRTLGMKTARSHNGSPVA